jgi:hypothetical protein
LGGGRLPRSSGGGDLAGGEKWSGDRAFASRHPRLQGWRSWLHIKRNKSWMKFSAGSSQKNLSESHSVTTLQGVLNLFIVGKTLTFTIAKADMPKRPLNYI